MLMPVLEHVPQQAEAGGIGSRERRLASLALLLLLLLDLPAQGAERSHRRLGVSQPGHAQWGCQRAQRIRIVHGLFLCGHWENQLLLLILLMRGLMVALVIVVVAAVIVVLMLLLRFRLGPGLHRVGLHVCVERLDLLKPVQVNRCESFRHYEATINTILYCQQQLTVSRRVGSGKSHRPAAVRPSSPQPRVHDGHGHGGVESNIVYINTYCIKVVSIHLGHKRLTTIMVPILATLRPVTVQCQCAGKMSSSTASVVVIVVGGRGGGRWRWENAIGAVEPWVAGVGVAVEHLLLALDLLCSRRRRSKQRTQRVQLRGGHRMLALLA
jgi:hypothetical protein